MTFRMFDKVKYSIKQDKSGLISVDELKEIFGGISEDMWK